MIRRLLAGLTGDGGTSGPGPASPAATILLVDDDPALRELLTLSLEGRGYRVVTAADGRDGVTTARRERPDLVVMDGSMPVMDGFEALKRLRRDRRTARIPVIMLTMRVKEGDVLVGFRYGAQEYLTKPVAIDELLASIEEQLRKAR